jgi:hypothetical protein
VRKLALLAGLLMAVAVPSVVLAADHTSADGCLVVVNANAVVTVNARGTLVGRIDQGQVTITDPVAGDGTVKVTGADQIDVLTPTKKRYFSSLSGMRFRAGGKTVVRVEGVGIDLSAVGRGKATLNGGDFFLPGTFSVDSDSFCQESFRPVPSVPQTFTLGAPTTG